MEFANPMAPPGHASVPETPSRNLTNADFRKLMMTPRVPGGATPMVESARSGSQSTKGAISASQSSALQERKKRKQYYASLRKQEDDKLAELAEKYRDRAKERRDGLTGNEGATDDPYSATAGYHAVAPDITSNLNAAEKRKQMIQESKFLGGDMEHTHLVKGLDYALLQKVRSEIEQKEKEEEEFEEALRVKQEEKARTDKKAQEEVDEQHKLQFRTAMAKNINRLLFTQSSVKIERHEHFLPHRMAYIMELDEAESDIPTTLIRSKQDCPQIDATTTLTTNDIVINKLTQILGYLRSGLNMRKSKKKEEERRKKENSESLNNTSGAKGAVDKDVNIFDDVGDYVPSRDRRDKEREREKDRDRRRERDYRRDKGEQDSRDRDDRRERDDRRRERDERDRRDKSRYFEDKKDKEMESEKPLEQQQGEQLLKSVLKPEQSQSRFKDKLAQLTQQDDYYSECYPGMPENDDAVVDSDEEEDFSKMDAGNKKGPINRWDFDTHEEYAEYMNQKEALPKAAFQYGVKMAEGRKTRTNKLGPQQGQKKDKMKLDRELQQINQILAKRKASEGGGGSSKQPRYEDYE